jgi:hypothetical protein
MYCAGAALHTQQARATHGGSTGLALTSQALELLVAAAAQQAAVAGFC